jgi:hypothetical protein
MYAETLRPQESGRTECAGYCMDKAMELEEALETTRYWLRCMPEGASPPTDAEECLSWGFERWVAFWVEWDENRSPCSKFMKNFARYHASVERTMSLYHHMEAALWVSELLDRYHGGAFTTTVLSRSRTSKAYAKITNASCAIHCASTTISLL